MSSNTILIGTQVILSTAILGSLLYAGVLYSEINELRDDVLQDMHSFRGLANDAWRSMVQANAPVNGGALPDFGSIFTRAKRSGSCNCGPQPSNCPAGPPGPPGAPGDAGLDGENGQAGPNGQDGAGQGSSCPFGHLILQIRNEFREIFRSHHRGNVSEVAIFIGTCPVRSTYSYRVPITICEAEDSTHKSCGDTCAELNDFERRKINRDLFMHSCSKEQQSNETNKTNKNHRLFVFIKGSEDMVNEEIEEEDPPFGSKQSFHYSFIHEKCNCDGVPAPRNDGKWLRMVPYIVHSKH